MCPPIISSRIFDYFATMATRAGVDGSALYGEVCVEMVFASQLADVRTLQGVRLQISNLSFGDVALNSFGQGPLGFA